MTGRDRVNANSLFWPPLLSRASQQEFRVPTLRPDFDQSSPRPWLSVMIPSYGRPRYLAKTIESVLSQGLEDSQIQIEVVDDGTPGEAIKEVVERCGQGRVGYHKQAENVGAARNWNTCIERARGQWVHILHDDDWVLPGYFEAVRATIEAHPQVVMVFSRVMVVDDEGEWLWILEGARSSNGSGVLPDALWDLSLRNCVCPSVAVVRREAYLELGGYCPQLHSTYDWEMFQRLARLGELAYLRTPYLCYRVHSETLSHQHLWSGRRYWESDQLVRRAVRWCEKDGGRRQAALRTQSEIARSYMRRSEKVQDWRAAFMAALWRFYWRPRLSGLGPILKYGLRRGLQSLSGEKS